MSKIFFDKVAFSKLLKKAVGSRTQIAFSKQAGLSQEHLSRLINARLCNSPNLETLLRISQNTTTVTYEELLQAAGYTGIKGKNTDSLPHPDMADIKLITATILSALSQFSITWTVEYSSVDSGDISIHLKCPLSHWYFHCLNNTTVMTIQKQMEINYFKLIFEEFVSAAKYTFVTASVTEYNYYISHIPLNLAVNLSIILVDINAMQIISETLLQSNSSLTDEILKLYSF